MQNDLHSMTVINNLLLLCYWFLLFWGREVGFFGFGGVVVLGFVLLCLLGFVFVFVFSFPHLGFLSLRLNIRI